MGSRAVDHDQVLSAVVAALTKSSSRVADCNSDFSAEFAAREQQQQQQPQQDHRRSKKRASHSGHHNLFACFTGNSGGKIITSRQSATWPRSPSRIMSRLLLSPGMSPDNRILAGDQSPAKPNSKLRSVTFQSARRMDRSEESRGEPTSPKVTCMGTVKAPKSKAPSMWSNTTHRNQTLASRTKQQQQQQDSLLDLSQFEHRSGELRRSSRPQCEQQQRSRSSSTSMVSGDSRKNPGNSWSTHQEQCNPNLDADRLAATRSRSLPVEIDANPRAADFEVRSSRSTALKRPEEVCIWRRRCVAEPLRLAIAENSPGQPKSILVNGPSSAL